MRHGGGGGGTVLLGVLHGLFMLALLVLVVLVCIWLARYLFAGGHAGDPAVAELRRAYAAGEVSREDYLTRIADLRDNKPQPRADKPTPPADNS